MLFGILIPLLAVNKPTESTLVTSSYVKVPPTETFPEKFPSTADMLPEKTPLVAVTTPEKLPPDPSKGPTNLDPVIIPTR